MGLVGFYAHDAVFDALPCLALPCPNNALPSCHQQPSEANSNTLF
jgi:hypothetical protein